jgi:hypothetical protein
MRCLGPKQHHEQLQHTRRPTRRRADASVPRPRWTTRLPRGTASPRLRSTSVGVRTIREGNSVRQLTASAMPCPCVYQASSVGCLDSNLTGRVSRTCSIRNYRWRDELHQRHDERRYGSSGLSSDVLGRRIPGLLTCAAAFSGAGQRAIWNCHSLFQYRTFRRF